MGKFLLSAISNLFVPGPRPKVTPVMPGVLGPGICPYVGRTKALELKNWLTVRLLFSRTGLLVTTARAPSPPPVRSTPEVVKVDPPERGDCVGLKSGAPLTSCPMPENCQLSRTVLVAMLL